MDYLHHTLILFLLDDCESDEFRCPGGECALLIWRCDGWPDCEDNSDEDVDLCGTTTTSMTTISKTTLPGEIYT